MASVLAPSSCPHYRLELNLAFLMEGAVPLYPEILVRVLDFKSGY